MRIAQIKIRNYKVFRDVVIDRIGDMAVFVGDNGSGKSTIFDVLAFLRDCVRVGIREAVQARGGIDAIRSREQEGDIAIAIVLRGPSSDSGTITYELVIGEMSGLPIVVQERLYADEEMPYLALKMGVGFAMNQGEANQEATSVAEPHLLGLSTIGSLGKYPIMYQVKRHIEGIYAYDWSTEDARSRTTTNAAAVSFPTGGSVASITQHMLEHRPEEYRYLLNNLRVLIPEIQGVDTIRNEDGVQVRFRSQFQKPFSASQISDGVRKLYSYLLLLWDANPPSLLCIDEPENQVYPNTQRGLADFFRIYSTNNQIFVATHAPTFLDAVELPEAYYIEKGNDGFSNIRRVQDIPMVEQFYKEGDPLGALWNQGFFGEGR